MRTILGWFSAGWQQLAFGLALVGICSGFAYTRGHTDGENAILASETKAYATALTNFHGKVDTMVAKASADAFKDFDARMTAMQTMTAQLSHDQEIINANAQTLAGALRGRFALTPGDRLRFECIRRPADARCATAAGTALPASFP